MKTSVSIIFLSVLLINGCTFVINKMAFLPDTEDVLTANQLPSNVKEVFIETEDRIKIQCYFIPNRSSDKILVYFHGNAGNICHRLSDLLIMNRLGINVLGISYRGYGKSEGKASEKGIYLDGQAALNHVTQKLGFSINNVIIFGRSIGTAVAINISQNINIGGLIIVSPLTSGEDIASASGLIFASFWVGDLFNNIDRIDHVSCPVLVIHGTQDRVIPFQMGKRLYNKIKTKKRFVKIEGAGHNNLSNEYKKSYWLPIFEFITQ